jgi:hypothetical protein
MPASLDVRENFMRRLFFQETDTQWTAYSNNLEVALFSDSVTEAGVGTELSGSGYARETVPLANWTISASPNFIVSNAVIVDFGTFSATVTITSFAIYETVSGRLLMVQDLPAPKELLLGAPVNFLPGDLTARLDM